MRRTRRGLVAIIFLMPLFASSSTGDEPAASFDALMHHVSQLAGQRLEADDPPVKEKLKEEMRRALSKAFDLRQAHQRSEIESMQRELAAAEVRLNERQSLRRRIIDRKLEDIIAATPAKWSDNSGTDTNLTFDLIGKGDTVAVHVEGALPYNAPNSPPSPPPVTPMPDGQIVTGFPFVVGSDGAIRLPLIGLIEIAGLTIREAEAKIRDAYVTRDILREERAHPIITLAARAAVPKENPATAGATAGDAKAADAASGEPAAPTIQAGDTLATWIQGVLPAQTASDGQRTPPTLLLASGRAVMGYPLDVAAEGTIRLPLLGSLMVEGLTVRDAESAAFEAYKEKEILRADIANPVQFVRIPKSIPIQSVIPAPN